MESGFLQALHQISPKDNFLADPGLVLERFFEYADGLTSVVERVIGMDLTRALTRAKQVKVSHMEFFVSSIAAILSQHPSLTAGLSAETVAEALLLEPGRSDLLTGPTSTRRWTQRLVSSFLRPFMDMESKPELRGAEKEEELTASTGPMTTVFEFAETLREVMRTSREYLEM